MKKIILTQLIILRLFCSCKAQWIDQGPGGQSLSSVGFFDANNGWVCGAQGTLFRTVDGGNTWQPNTYFNASTARNRLIAVANPQANRVVLLAEQASATQPEVVYLSQNNGVSWGAIDNGNFNNLYFFGGTQGLLVGDGGTLRISLSGGSLWTPVPSGTQNNLRDCNCSTTQDCYVVGDGGTLRKSNNGITTWRALNSTTSARLNGVYFASTTQGYIVGDNGTALRTADAGVTWTPMAVGTNVNLNDVYFLSTSVGFIVGELGTVLLTTDGGGTWRTETTNTFESLYSIAAAADGSVIRIAGGGGTVLKRGPVVLGLANAQRSDTWQAYPNPFAQSLRIATAKQYGNCQAQLVNSLGQAVVSKTWTSMNAQQDQDLIIPEDLPNGVYYLLFRSAEFAETRRLVHVR